MGGLKGAETDGGIWEVEKRGLDLLRITGTGSSSELWGNSR